MKTVEPTQINDNKRLWHAVDVKGQTLGRIATKIATLLMGKAKPDFARYMDLGDYVVVTNSSQVTVSGNKASQKMYTSYSGYPGGMHKEAFKDLLSRKPAEVIRRAVFGMLPKNKLRDRMITRLYVYAGDKHPYQEKFENKNEKKIPLSFRILNQVQDRL